MLSFDLQECVVAHVHLHLHTVIINKKIKIMHLVCITSFAIPALVRLRQESSEFEANLDYRETLS